jgi:hypothetical protein
MRLDGCGEQCARLLAFNGTAKVIFTHRKSEGHNPAY